MAKLHDTEDLARSELRELTERVRHVREQLAVFLRRVEPDEAADPRGATGRGRRGVKPRWVSATK